MLPPPGLEPSVLSLLETATPTSILATAIASAASSAVVAVATIASSYTDNSSSFSESTDNGECRLLGPFAIIVQGALGCLALLALVYKRWRERPQRPLKIWFYDVSKQVVGSILVHVANLLMSMLSSGQFNLKVEPSTVIVQRSLASRMVDQNGHYSPNPCSFYLLNLAIDTTVGIPILIFLLRIFTALFAMTAVGNPRESIESGNYGNPPRATWWFKQSMIYFLGLMGMKICVLVIFLVLPWISRVGDWALKWTEGDEVLQVMFVMLIFPVIMNATQYYIIDSFIKNQKPDHERIPDEDDSNFEGGHHGSRYDDPHSGSSDEIHSGDEDDEEVLSKANENKKTRTKVGLRSKRGSSGSRPSSSKSSPRNGSFKHRRDYDPILDGDISPTVVGSASTSTSVRERDRLALKEADSEDEEERARISK